MNRSERLDAIEKQIATLKTQADNKAAAAQSAAETAQNERDALEQLRQELCEPTPTAGELEYASWMTLLRN